MPKGKVSFGDYVCAECNTRLETVAEAPYCPDCDTWIDELENEMGEIIYPEED